MRFTVGCRTVKESSSFVKGLHEDVEWIRILWVPGALLLNPKPLGFL